MMKRLRFAFSAALVIMLLAAAPALAQRDPFDPIDSGGGDSGSSSSSGGGGPFTQPDLGGSDDNAGQGDTSGDTGGQEDPTQPPDSNDNGESTNPPDTDPEVEPSDDTLPNTGAEPVSWLVMAYALIAIGGGLVVTGRLFHPSFARNDIPRRYQPRHSKRPRHLK